MSQPNNHNNIDRMKMAIRAEFEKTNQIHFNDLFRAIVNPESNGAFFFAVALEEMEFAGELNRSVETYTKVVLVEK